MIGLVLGLAAPEVAHRAIATLAAIDLTSPPPPHHPSPQHDRQSGGSPGVMQPRAPERPTPPIRLPLPALSPAPPAGGLADQDAGSGLAGSGAGSGSGNDAGDGGGSDAEWIKGQINDSDYPREAREARHQGVTRTRIAVDASGHATGCAIRRSSGSALLDGTTCRLVLKRFRFRPARDAAGTAIPDFVDYDQEWSITGYMGD